MPKIDELWWELDVRSQKLNEGVERAEQRLKKFVGFVKAHPIAVLGALGAAFALTGFAAAKFAEQIDRHLRRVDALIPKTTQGVDRMRQRLLELARTTPVPLEELAAGLEQVVAIGEKDPDKAFLKLATAAKLATASGTDLQSTIATLDNIMDAFGLSAEQSADVLDILVTAAQRGTPLAELTPILGQVGAQARAAGVDLGQVVAAINALTEGRGVTVRQAVGAIREAFGDLGDATEGTGRTQAALGIQLTVVEGKLRFAGRGAEDFNGTLTDMESRGGRAEKMLGRLSREADVQSAIVRNQLKTAWVEFGETASPLLLTLTKAASGFLDTLSGESGVQRLHQQLRELAGGIHDMNIQTDDATHHQANMNRGAERMIASLKGIESLRILQPEIWDKFSRAITQLPREDLPALKEALLGLSTEERAQIGLTEQLLQQFLHSIGLQVAATRQVRAAASEGGTTTPPVSPETEQKLLQLRADMAARLVSLTTSVADDLQAQLDALLAKIGQLPEHLRGEFMAGLTRLRSEVQGARTFEGLDKELEAIERRVNQINDAFGEVPATLGLEILPAVEQLITQLQAAMDQQQRGSALWTKYRDQLQRAQELAGKLAKNIGNAGQGQQDLNAELDKTLDKLELQASRIQSAVRGAIQLGEAFGLLDDRAAAMLQSITQIATEIPKVSAVLKAGGGLEKALPGLLGIAGGVASLIGSLFGESPEERRRQEILQQNTEAIKELTQRIGEFFIETTGKQFAEIRGALPEALERAEEAIRRAREFALRARARGAVDAERVGGREALRSLAAAGVSVAELRELADALGIAFAGAQPTLTELKQLMEAMAQTQLTQFAQTFAGQIELLAREFELFDISDPIDQLRRLREIALGFGDSPLIDALFGGLDLSTAEGRAALEERIRSLYRQLQAGTVTPEQLGGLTPQQLLELLSQLEATMDRVAEGGEEQGRTAQFQVSREVTETTAGRLVSIGVTSLLWLEEIARNTSALVPTLQPPSAAELAAYNPGGLTIETLEINVTVAGASASDAQRIGDDVGRAAAAALDRELGTKLRKRALLQGSVTRN
jgi:TP901 family phage tail tape measure protein